MYSASTSSFLSALSLLIATATAQIPAPTPAPKADSGDGNAVNLVNYLIPTASITSLSPQQSSILYSDASTYLTGYTASHPIGELELKIGADVFLGGTAPSPAQSSSLAALIGDADDGLLNNPSAFISSVNAQVSPFPFATDVMTYENDFVDGLRTVVAAALSVPAPSATTSSSTAMAPKQTGVVGGVFVVAAGLVGVGLL